MKYKIIGIISIIMVFVITLSIPAFSYSEKTRYQQHSDAVKKESCSHSDDVFCTHLPLVQINTFGNEIPGKAIDGNFDNVTTADDGSSSVICEFDVTDNEKTNNHIYDTAQLKSRAYINIRGNFSRTFDKSSYAIRLVTENGENNPQSVMGMDAHHEWALHGPYLDKTLIRNYMWYNIAGEIMDYAPNVRFCEVVINGEYKGVYVCTETITAGQNGARLNLSVDKKNNTFSGYLLRLDRGSDNEIKNINSFTQYALRANTSLEIQYPGTANLTKELSDSICKDFSDFEKALYSYDFDSKDYGYKNFIDTESFADYFLINELTLNYDAGWLSTYIYKDIDGKFRMCIWDFNSACDNYQDTFLSPFGFQFQNCLWYVMLMKDEDFVEEIIDRYYELKKTYFNYEYLESYIDNTIKYLGYAVDRNYQKWGYSFEEKYDMLTPKERNPRSYNEAVSAMKKAIKLRIEWLDDNIETLRQYSAESRIKKFNENAN